MDIAVVGGTGTLGRHVVAELVDRGHAVRALGRNAPERPLAAGATHVRVDISTGEGLDAALAGVDAVVDASNGPPSRKAEAVLVTGTEHLLDAERKAGVGHHVCVSIVGTDRVPTAYYRVKVRQEEAVERSDVPWTIVRATQFHDLVASWFATAARARVLPGVRVPLQPLDTRTAAELVARTAEQAPRTGRTQIAGPEIRSAHDLARIWRARTNAKAAIVPLPLPGKLGRALRAGELTSEQDAAKGSPTFEAWLSASGADG